MALLCIVLGVAIVALVVLAALCGWGDVSPARRSALGVMAAGLAWAGVTRLQLPVTLGDVIFLAGLFGYLVQVFRAPLTVRLDALDGRVDGRAGPLPLARPGRRTPV